VTRLFNSSILKSEAAVTLWLTAAIFAASAEPIIVKLGYAAGVQPLQAFVLKNCFAAAVVLLLTRKFVWVGKQQLPRLGLLALLLFCTNGLILLSLTLVPAVVVMTLVTTTPALVAIINSAMGRDKLTVKFWSGFGLCLLGVILMLEVKSLEGNPLGILAVLTSIITSSIYRVQMETATKTINPLVVSSYQFPINVCLCIPLMFITPAISFEALKVGAIIGSGAALANVAFLSAMALIGSTRVSIISLFQRPLLLVLAIVVLNEPASPLQILGIILTIAGVQVAQVKRKHTIIYTPDNEEMKKNNLKQQPVCASIESGD
jgi:drug/metabolite transporter (DMT)-like permease